VEQLSKLLVGSFPSCHVFSFPSSFLFLIPMLYLGTHARKLGFPLLVDRNQVLECDDSIVALRLSGIERPVGSYRL
jgi:hypothetical protein